MDDISYTPGERCSTNTGGVCDFEVGLCSWENQGDGADDSDWIVSRNGTGNPGSGPRCDFIKISLTFFYSVDHTYGTGFGNYLHMDGSHMESGQRAILRSPLIQGQVHPDGDCFQFWFFLRYDDTGLIRVNLINEDGTDEQLIEIQGDMGPTWRTERLPIKSKSPYRVG